MVKKLPAAAAFGLGCLTFSIIALFLMQTEDFTDTYLRPLLIGATGSVLATLIIALVTLADSGISLPFTIINSQEGIYDEATRLIQALGSQRASENSVLVTAMARKETKSDGTHVHRYMRAADELLKKAGIGEEAVYRMMGRFQDRNEVQERLDFFGSKAACHLRLATFDDVWPVDVLVAGTRKVIVAFRSHGSGELSWAIMVSNRDFARRIGRWLNDLWISRHTRVVWDGKKIIC